MVSPSRQSITTGVVIACLIASQLSATIFASEEPGSTSPSTATSNRTISDESLSRTAIPAGLETSDLRELQGPISRSLPTSIRGVQPTVVLLPAATSNAFAQGYYYPRRHRHDGAVAAMVFGAAASITGTALLVYANRPECSVNVAPQPVDGCGYGTKVIGGAVLSAGLVGLMVGALALR